MKRNSYIKTIIAVETFDKEMQLNSGRYCVIYSSGYQRTYYLTQLTKEMLYFMMLRKRAKNLSRLTVEWRNGCYVNAIETYYERSLY